MAVGTNDFPVMPALAGVRLSAVAAGIRYQNRHDLCLIELPSGSVAAGCYTQNLYQAAPVLVAKAHADKADTSYWLTNAGNANACTGEQGIRDAEQSCQSLAALTAVEPEQVLPFSTGVIGEHLNLDALQKALPALVEGLAEEGWQTAANAIMTTDTFAKGVTREAEILGQTVRVNGIVKGAGMIRPDMATMLAYVVTDACVEKSLLQEICTLAVEKSFNRITVDGDTSTNDACVMAATGRAGHKCIESLSSDAGQRLLALLTDVCQQLAQLLIRDAEGASKFVRIQVKGGKTAEDCLTVAYTLGHSPLVKTALFASDPNWGRMVAAIGRSGVIGLNASAVRLWLDDVLIVDNGGRAASYSEEAGQAVFDQAEFSVVVDLAMGTEEEEIWTCDLSYDYVRINADYRS